MNAPIVDDLHPAVRGMVEVLPCRGETWSETEQRRWLDTCAYVLRAFHGSPDWPPANGYELAQAPPPSLGDILALKTPDITGQNGQHPERTEEPAQDAVNKDFGDSSVTDLVRFAISEFDTFTTQDLLRRVKELKPTAVEGTIKAALSSAKSRGLCTEVGFMAYQSASSPTAANPTDPAQHRTTIPLPCPDCGGEKIKRANGIYVCQPCINKKIARSRYGDTPHDERPDAPAEPPTELDPSPVANEQAPSIHLKPAGPEILTDANDSGKLALCPRCEPKTGRHMMVGSQMCRTCYEAGPEPSANGHKPAGAVDLAEEGLRLAIRIGIALKTTRSEGGFYVVRNNEGRFSARSVASVMDRTEALLVATLTYWRRLCPRASCHRPAYRSL